jgi:hypothetical protein
MMNGDESLVFRVSKEEYVSHSHRIEMHGWLSVNFHS